MKDLLTPAEKRAHGFRAVCRQGADVPYVDLTDDQAARAVRWSYGPNKGEIQSSWDKKLKLEIATVVCAFATTDRVEFERHMLEVHGKKPTLTPNPDDSTRSLSLRATGKWRTPKAPAEGKPYAPTKRFVNSVVTCEGCGLVMERDGRYASELFIREHLELCVERAA